MRQDHPSSACDSVYDVSLTRWLLSLSWLVIGSNDGNCLAGAGGSGNDQNRDRLVEELRKKRAL